MSAFHDRDSPVEYTGEAHLVTVSCSECGESVTVAEDAAASPNPITCEDCVHDCLGHTEPIPFDRVEGDLPRFAAFYRCMECGSLWTFDTREGRHERGLPEGVEVL